MSKHPRINCAHCGRDVACNPKNGKVSGHLLIADTCLPGCCDVRDGLCAGSDKVGGVA